MIGSSSSQATHIIICLVGFVGLTSRVPCRFGALESWCSNWPMESAQCFHCWWEIARCGKIMQECLSNWHCFQDSKRIHILMWDAHLFFKRIWGGFGHETCITSIHQLAIFTGTRTKPRISWTSTRPPSALRLLQPMLGKWYPQAGEIGHFSSLAL